MRRVLRRTALVIGFAPLLVLLVATVAGAQASAPPSPDPLAAARALFGEALRDENAERFGEALEKFERVRAVRDTPSIEYRIGSCYEGLGDAVLAFRAYLAAQALGQGDPQSRDVLRAASDRLDGLAKRVARLTLVMPSPGSPSAEARVDDGVVAPGVGAMALAPGHHVVSATADGAIPFRSDIVLAGGDQVSVTVVLGPKAAATAPPETDRRPLATVGWLAIGGGVLLTAASVVLLVVRHDEIANLNRACPGGACPSSADASSLEATRSRALVEGPLGIACGVAGLALAGGGVYWVTRGHPSSGVALGVVPMVARESAGLAVTGALR